MTKAELKEWIKENTLYLTTFTIKELLSKIDQLPEPEPKQGGLLPFCWPYDKEKYRVVTRDGRDVTQLVKFECADSYPFHGVIDVSINGWRENGTIYKVGEHSLDLFLSPIGPEMVTRWVNYYPDGDHYIYESKEQADSVASNRRIGPAIRVQFPKPTK